MKTYLDFEKPIEDLAIRIEELKQTNDSSDQSETSELATLEKKSAKLQKDIFSTLNPWQKCLTARHPDRPYTLDYINLITKEFIELHGDRHYSDDSSIVGGLAHIDKTSVMIIGHQKGRSTKERIMRNFGQPHPEGYRKALRLIKLAERFEVPVLTLIDTPGAYPGLGAEERGQSEAIATNMMELSRVRVPIISVVIGEGGSGGALALSVADRLFMLEHSVYSVISPEGCAAILWKKENSLTQNDFSKAATALKMTSSDLLKYKIIDGIIEEPLGGAHRNHEQVAFTIKKKILESIEQVSNMSVQDMLAVRIEKYRNIGFFLEGKS